MTNVSQLIIRSNILKDSNKQNEREIVERICINDLVKCSHGIMKYNSLQSLVSTLYYCVVL